MRQGQTIRKIGKLANRAIIGAGLLGLIGSFSAPEPSFPQYAMIATAPFDGRLSVLTYNVRGLPWPFASGRSTDLQEIASQLRNARTYEGRPEIVLLQEAFVDDARNIGAAAGYRYIVDGPSADDSNSVRLAATDRDFAAGKSWLKGEGIGKFAGSGLQILSDLPVTEVHRMPFPEQACAGFDCVSNKGMLIVTVAIPQLGTRLQIANIHMNSKRHSHVSLRRQNQAYQMQVNAAHAFIQSHRDPRYPIVFGGDFNPGAVKARRQALFAGNWLASPRNDALRTLAAKSTLPADADDAMQRGADWQFFHSGTDASISAQSVAAPFGKNSAGKMLSDHVGYVIDYRIEGAN